MVALSSIEAKGLFGSTFEKRNSSNRWFKFGIAHLLRVNLLFNKTRNKNMVALSSVEAKGLFGPTL